MKKSRLVITFLITLLVVIIGVEAFFFIKEKDGNGAVMVSRIYTWGSTGDIVREIQRRLKEWGYYDGSIDGVYGQQTFDAVKYFQQNHGINPDGIVGSVTLSLLGITPATDVGGTEWIETLPRGKDYEETLRLLASVINGEARGEPYEGQVAVGAVILNRVESPVFPNTLNEVIFQRGAFDAVSDGQIYLVPTDSAFRAAGDALNGWDPTGGALYYWNPVTATSQWIWSIPITARIGRHVFGVR